MDRKSFLCCLDMYPPGRAADPRLAERYGHLVPGEGILIPLPITQGDVAEMVAATRECVIQIMVCVKRASVFSVDPTHEITVHRPEVLTYLCRF